jgi:hypothetical protein
MTRELLGPKTLEGLKAFQVDTVEYVFERMYGKDPVHKFLVADEVGLGKTLVARGMIAKVIDYQRAAGVKRIDIVYICSSADIAQQNVAKLNVTGQKVFTKNRSGENGSINMTWLGRRFLFVRDPAWTSKFGPAVVEGNGFIEYPILADRQDGTPAGRVIAALTAHYARTLAKCPRSALLEAFGLSLKAKWVETSVLAPTVDAMVKRGQVLTAVEKNSALYWLPGQFPPALVQIDGGRPATQTAVDDASDALFG